MISNGNPVHSIASCGQFFNITKEGDFITDSVSIQASRWATSQVGCKYSQARRTQEGVFDCSSLVARAYSAFGKRWRYGGSVPLSFQEVYDDDFELIWPANYADIGVSKGKKEVIALADQPGDLQFICTNGKTGRSNRITHVAIVNSKHTIVHARGSKYGVCENDIDLYAGKVCAVSRYNPTCVLRFGIKGYRTLALQRALNLRGFTLEEDGDFGRKTEAAVCDFQKAEGLSSTGEVSQLMLECLGIHNNANLENSEAKKDFEYISITGKTVNIRSGPGTDYESIGIAKNHDIYPVVNTDGWYPILHNDTVRWVSANYASVICNDISN